MPRREGVPQKPEESVPAEDLAYIKQETDDGLETMLYSANEALKAHQQKGFSPETAKTVIAKRDAIQAELERRKAE
jgi:hypothetical protein